MSSSRRDFLAAGAAAAAAAAMPWSLSACAVGAGPSGGGGPPASPPRPGGRPPRPAGDKLKLLVVGVGGRGHGNLQGVKGEDVVALCDVDAGRLQQAAAELPSATTHADYRDAMQRTDLDAVVVSTPDHTHFAVSKLALERGLDVYCEKPLTHTVAQARELDALAEQRGLVTQLGTQIHANENYRRVVEAVQSGAIGRVRRVHVFVNGTDWSAAGLPAEVPVPDGLDYELWLGPAAAQPYREGFHPAGWRRYWDFGGGTTADMACHFMDLPFWALGLHEPEAVQADGPAPHPHGAPRGLQCDYWFAPRSGLPGVQLTWWGGPGRRPTDELAARGLDGWRNGVLFVGDDGWLISDYTRHELGPRDAFAGWQPPPKAIASSPGHYAEWIQCCKERSLPTCWFGYGGPLTEAVLLANVAYRGARGRRLPWDPARLRLGDDDALRGLLGGEA